MATIGTLLKIFLIFLFFKTTETMKEKGFGRAAFIGVPMIGHYNPYLRLLETMNNKYGLDNYTTSIPEVEGLFNRIIRTTSTQKYNHLRPDQIIPFLIHDALNLVFEIEEIWNSNNYKPEVILLDSLSLLGRILSMRNNIPSVILFSGFPLSIEEAEMSLTHMYKILDKKTYEQILVDVSSMEHKYGIVIQKYTSGIPLFIPVGSGGVKLSIVPKDYPFIIQTDRIYTGPMFRKVSEDIDFDFAPHTGKKVVFISLGTLFNLKIDFFNTVIASCLKYLYKDCIVLISMMNDQVIEAVSKKFKEQELQKNGIFIRPFWNQIKVLEKADLFVSHCGNGSYLEALSKAVPILGYPHAADQFQIASEVKRLGYGDILPQQFDEEIFYESVIAILSNSAFKLNMLGCIDWFDSEKSLETNMREIERSFLRQEFQ